MPNGSDSEPDDADLLDQGKVKVIVKMPPHGQETQFVMRLTTQFAKVFAGAEKAWSREPNSFHLLYDGTRIQADTTPKMMEWKIGKVYEVEAFFPQEGGCQTGSESL